MESENTKRDIRTRSDIDLLVKRFYAKVRRDDTIAFVFNDVAKVHWESHLPRIGDFWEAVLFQETRFDGNPLETHKRLNAMETLRPEYFRRWLELFTETLDELFHGPTARSARFRAENIARVFRQHLEGPAAPFIDLGPIE